MRRLCSATVRYVFALAAVFLSLVSLAQAQSSATVLGTVSDESGAVVPGATVTLRSAETGQTRTTASAADGS